MGELLARVRAVLRRSRHLEEDRQVTTDDFTIDLAAKRATS
jgi:DNA-binding response OmpR family regulator